MLISKIFSALYFRILINPLPYNIVSHSWHDLQFKRVKLELKLNTEFNSNYNMLSEGSLKAMRDISFFFVSFKIVATNSQVLLTKL